MMTLHSIELGIFLFVNSSWDLINDSHVVCLKFICGLKRDKKWGNPLFKLLKVVLLLWLKSEKVYWQCHFCFKLWPNTLWDLLSRPQYLIQWKTWSLIGMKILVTNQAGAKEGWSMDFMCVLCFQMVCCTLIWKRIVTGKTNNKAISAHFLIGSLASINHYTIQ